MTKLELKVRIPFFGEQAIYLHKESKECYQILKDLREIDRLEKKVMHLGIIHEIGDVPSFGRWVHIATMLTLIEEIKRVGSSEALGFGFNSEVSLLNGVKFTSAEEFLKCWAMLYSIGHFVGTFTSEHALLRSIIHEKDEFIRSLTENVDDSSVKEAFKKIVEREEIFGVFKLFTTLKIINKLNNDKFIELAKMNLLEDQYLEKIEDLTQRTKLENLLSLFKFIRKLSFTILDGYFSQNCVLVNHYYFLLNIDKILQQKPYNQLLDSLNMFYTQTIYQSPENMFYHHEFARIIENEVFSKHSKSWNSLIQKIIENEIDKEIEKVIEENIDRIRENKQEHFGRVILQSIDYPVSTEKKIFSDISGGIIWNIPAKYYEVDFYLTISTLDDTLRILRAVKEVYIKSKATEKIQNFEEIAKNILINTLKIRLPEYEFVCDKRKFGFYSVLFSKDDLDNVIELINKRIGEGQIDSSTRTELVTSKDILRDIVSKGESNDIFIFSPNIISKKNNDNKAQCDFLLMSYSSSTNDLTIHVSEIKKACSRGEFTKEQIQKYLMHILGLYERSEDLASKLKDQRNLDEKIDDITHLRGDLSGNKVLLSIEYTILS